MDVKEFLETIYQDCEEGYLSLTSLPDHTMCWCRTSEIEKVAAFAKRYGQTVNAYFGICPRKEALSQKRGGADAILSVPALYADIDVKGPAHAQTDLPETFEQAVSFLKGLPVPPSILVDSGNGLHAYWLLEHPFRICSERDRGYITLLLEGWSRIVRTEAAKHGWKLDPVHDLARMFRMPGTINHKTEAKKPCRILESTGIRYSLDDFAAFISATVQEDVRAPFHNNAAGPAERVLKECTFMQYCRDHAAELPEPWWHAMVSNLALTADGNAAVHELSSPYPNYSRSETESKFQRALQEAKPHTCRYIQEVLGFQCACKKQVKAPIVHACAIPRSTAREDFAGEEASRLQDMHPHDNPRYGWNDIGNGNLFADYYKSVARYVPERKAWFIFNGEVWRPDVGNLKTMELCKALADRLMLYALSIEDERSRSAYIDFVRRWQSRKNRETILKDAQSVYPIPMSSFDSDAYLFNCKNGTLHLRTMAFTQHTPEDMLTKIAGVKYDPDARCTRWEQFIREVMSEDAKRADYLQRALGYALSGDTRYETLFILYGATTRNGKSTAMETFLKIMGEYGKTARPETIGMKMNSSSNTPTEDIARLAGARFVNISEPDKKLVLSAALVKTLTGNDTINARFLHENSFDFQPQFKLFVNTNFLPTVTDLTLFSSGRVNIIPFERHFEEHEQDKRLKGLLAKPENLSGILNWCLEGYHKLKKAGLEMPESVHAATEAYRHSSDKIGLFIEDMLVRENNGEERTAEVYAAYRQWCADNGFHVESMRNFKAMLGAVMNIERKRPCFGGEKTTVILGYKLCRGEDFIVPLSG